MSLIVSKPKDEFEQVPAGTFYARCYGLVDLGTQETSYKGEIKYKRQVLIMWELLDEEAGMRQDGKPFTISKTYTATLHEQGKLLPDLNAWRGKPFTHEELLGFDLRNILGAYCQLQVQHETNAVSGKTYANVTALMPLKGQKPEGFNELLSFNLDEPDVAAFNRLGDFTKRKVQAAAEFHGQEDMELAKEQTEGPTEDKPSPAKDEPVAELGEKPDKIDLSEIPYS
jgi:hypothetical protein